MAKFNVSVFLLHCFIPQSVEFENLLIEPFEGSGVIDVADLIDQYAEKILKQARQPEEQKTIMSKSLKDSGATVVVTFIGVEADDYKDAIKATEEPLLLFRDVIALRQRQRGPVAGFLVQQTDISPPMFFSHIRRQHAVLRKTHHLPLFDTESDIYMRLIDKAMNHGRLRLYLSLYGDTLGYLDTLITDVGKETRLLKTWSLLETMAFSETGTKNKKLKVKNLFKQFQVSYYPDYHNHLGKDLLDIAYSWRNIIAHTGGCETATEPEDIQFCQEFQTEFDDILESLSQLCGGLLHVYANSLP